MTDVRLHRVRRIGVLCVRQWEVADHQRILHSHGMGDAMDRTALRNDCLSVVVTINSDDIVSRQKLGVDAQGRGVIFCVIRR